MKGTIAKLCPWNRPSSLIMSPSIQQWLTYPPKVWNLVMGSGATAASRASSR